MKHLTPQAGDFMSEMMFLYGLYNCAAKPSFLGSAFNTIDKTLNFQIIE
jgi:hypothetical protein